MKNLIDKIEVFKQNSIRIRDGKNVIYVDPFELNEALHDASFILITHDHFDHYSPESIVKAANSETVLVVPEKMLKKAEEVSKSVGRIIAVRPGTSNDIAGLNFETVPAYNILKPFHPKSAEWVGYVLNVDGERVYIAGDTDATKEAKAVKCNAALIPIGGTYTMDAVKAAELANTICPDIVIPVHYGSVVGSPSDGEIFAANVKEPVRVEFTIKF